MEKVHYWSDGPMSQFINQYAFTNWTFLPPCMAKVLAAMSKMRPGVVVNNLQNFVEVAKAKFPSFVIAECSADDVCTSDEFLKELCGIKTWHHVEVVDNEIHGITCYHPLALAIILKITVLLMS